MNHEGESKFLKVTSHASESVRGIYRLERGKKMSAVEEIAMRDDLAEQCRHMVEFEGMTAEEATWEMARTLAHQYDFVEEIYADVIAERVMRNALKQKSPHYN